jgi:arginine decarboxylase
MPTSTRTRTNGKPTRNGKANGNGNGNGAHARNMKHRLTDVPTRKAEVKTLPPQVVVPTRVFFTSGVGFHKIQRVAMQHAMREAGLADCNLVKISSVIPPRCEVITRERGLGLLQGGAIAHAVIAQGETKEPHQRVSVALCWAQPDRDDLPGYITEVEEEQTKGKSEQTAIDEAGEAVITLLAERIDVKVDAAKLWSGRGRERTVRMGGVKVRVGSITESAVCPEAQDGESKYATAMAFAVYL